MTSTLLCTRYFLLVCAVFALHAAPVLAQESTPGNFSWREIFDADGALFLGGTAAGTAMLHRADLSLMLRAQDSTLVVRSLLTPLATSANLVGRPGSFVVSGRAFALGKAIGSDGLSDLGLHAMAALAITEVSTRAVKGLVGRARPGLSGDPNDFTFGSGFGNSERGAFPSGHASSAFRPLRPTPGRANF